MVEFSRRGFLGGMLSILAVASVPTFIPSPSEGNWIPRIYGNGKDYDGEGLQALFDGKDVILPADKIGIRGMLDGEHTVKGLIFHKGSFVIDREVYTNGVPIELEHANFDGRLLKQWEAFFNTSQDNRVSRDTYAKIMIGRASWQRSEGDMAIDVGGHQYSTKNTWMSEQNRFRPKRREIA